MCVVTVGPARTLLCTGICRIAPAAARRILASDPGVAW